jgi:hypothetical protein
MERQLGGQRTLVVNGLGVPDQVFQECPLRFERKAQTTAAVQVKAYGGLK